MIFPLTLGNHTVTHLGVLFEYSISELNLDPRNKASINCWLSNLYVPPELRGQGLGHRVMQDFIKALKAGGVSQISLTAQPSGKGTTPENLKRFYKSLGFKDWDEDYFTLNFKSSRLKLKAVVIKQSWNDLNSIEPNLGLKPPTPKKVRKIEPKKVKNPLSGDEHLNQ